MKANLTIGIPVWLDKIFTWPVMWYRRRKYGYDFRRIHLGEGIFTIVDADVYYRFGHLKWYVSGNGVRFYATRNKVIERGKTKMVYLHREIMNPPKGLLVDHRNRDSLDNRVANLRFATHAENVCNRQKTKSETSSRFRGVNFDKNRQLWASRIRSKGRTIWLGRFKDEIAAAKAYDKAAKRYHGEFAHLNFPEENAGA